jgi:uncharacterized protein (TIGR02118 family)
MIKVSLLFPNSATIKFDMEYYCKRHIPMLQKKLGIACKRVAVEEGLVGASPGLPPAFVAMGHLYFKSVEAFQAAFDPHEAAIMEDLPNCTNVQPTIQVSTVKIQRTRVRP